MNANAFAEDIYVSVAGGCGRQEINLQNNFLLKINNKKSTPINLEGAFGLYLNEYFRSEVALNYTKSGSKKLADEPSAIGEFKVNTKSIGLMLNLYADWKFFEYLTPNIMVGIGVQKSDATIKGDQIANILVKNKLSKTGFAWQLGAGIDISFADNFKGIISYRFRDIGFDNAKVDYVTSANGKLQVECDKVQMILIGARVEF
ncbi:tia invasion determinant-related protein [Reticulomyxa filosa]|uniref:Tia invasion determinant-related protein n=1 Tax=Reticulomyxa filosa TaxID=46433 RepID=X6P8S4_RETFI|nr:tia invasion determinant-related protein [Reticulomyxa filosa]|eukprot:ETO34915.1 tia invasion determinant-related protein [Reticulomyxa filosa]